jgi:cyclic beta-1,2-glucan synthetase
MRAEISLRRDDLVMRFILYRATSRAAVEGAGVAGARVLRPGEPLNWSGLPATSCFVIPLDEPAFVGA